MHRVGSQAARVPAHVLGHEAVVVLALEKLQRRLALRELEGVYPEPAVVVVFVPDVQGLPLGVGVRRQHVYLVPPPEHLEPRIAGEHLRAVGVPGQELVDYQQYTHDAPRRPIRRPGPPDLSLASMGCIKTNGAGE